MPADRGALPPRGLGGALVALLLAGCAGAPLRHGALPPGVAGTAPAISDAHRIALGAERVRLTREYFRIHHPRLAAAMPAGDGPEAIAFTPRLVVVHYTAIPTLDATLDAFRPARVADEREIIRRNGLLNVGIHFVVDRDGTIYRLYPETAMARHVIGLNHVAIGIENVGDGDLEDPRARAPLTRAQLAANVALVRYLAGKYPTIDFVIGHSEYRELEDPAHPAHALFHEEVPGYRTDKADPGERFLRRLRRALRRGQPLPPGGGGAARYGGSPQSTRAAASPRSARNGRATCS